MNRTIFEKQKKVFAPEGVWLSPLSFKWAVQSATYKPKRTPPDLKWKTHSRTGVESTALVIDGFNVVIQLKMSQTLDFALDDLGSYSENWAPGAIDRFKGKPGRHDRNRYRYFIPTYSYEERFENYHSMGYSKFDADVMARKAIKADFKRAEQYNNGELAEWDLYVKVFKKGVELGEAFLGLGGIDNIDETKPTILDDYWDPVAEALGAAKKKLAELRED